jgi:hypothetical protein
MAKRKDVWISIHVSELCAHRIDTLDLSLIALVECGLKQRVRRSNEPIRNVSLGLIAILLQQAYRRRDSCASIRIRVDKNSIHICFERTR